MQQAKCLTQSTQKYTIHVQYINTKIPKSITHFIYKTNSLARTRGKYVLFKYLVPGVKN